MYSISTATILLLTALSAQLASGLAVSTSTLTTAACSAPSDNICAQFHFANGTVSQDVHLDDGGCTIVADASLVAGINVFDCWCGLWKYVNFDSYSVLRFRRPDVDVMMARKI
jgi:hypothetical protein